MMRGQLWKDGIMRIIKKILLFISAIVIAKILYDAFFFLLFIVLASGTHSELDKMSNKELEEYFLKHKSELSHIVNICEQYPTIRRIEKDNTSYYDDNISDETKKKVKSIQEIVERLSIDNVQCGRSNMMLNNQLMGASFCLYSSGLGISGEGQSIDFETKKSRDTWKGKKKVAIPWETVYPLNKEGWSIVHTH